MSEASTPASFDYQRYAVLYVDDEETERETIGVLMTDQRMPVRTGTWLLEQARKEVPQIVRILATAYTDMEAAIRAVNTGGIYRYVTKPWDPRELEMTLKRGLEFFMVRRERDELLRQQLSVLRNTMIADRILGLGFLASGLSHHMRNMLVAVKTFLDLTPAKLEQEKAATVSVQDPEFWNDYYRTAQGQIDRMVTLLKDLWSASEMQGTRFNDRVNLRSVLEEVLSAHREVITDKQLVVNNTVPESLPALQVDGPRFRKLLELLLRDEVALLEPKHRIDISAEAGTVAGSQKEVVTLRIADNGKGLPQDQLRRVFDPFGPRNGGPADFGVNLMACFFIVHGHGGRIEAETLPQGGTCFTIRLPLDPAAALQERHNDEFLPRLLMNQTSWEQYFSDDR